MVTFGTCLDRISAGLEITEAPVPMTPTELSTLQFLSEEDIQEFKVTYLLTH